MDVRVSCIVLAGGRSHRFGADKLAAPLRGMPLLHHAVRAAAAASDEVLVVASPDGSAPSLPAIRTPLRLVRDARPHEGPLAGFHAGASVATGTHLLLVAGDQPDLVPAVLRRLLEEVDRGARAAVLGSSDPADAPFEPMPAAMDRERALVAATRALDDGHRSLVALLARLGVQVVPATAWEPLDPTRASVRDIDRPEDLAALTRSAVDSDVVRPSS